MKRVQDVRESAAYLTIMTRFLTKLYQVNTKRYMFQFYIAELCKGDMREPNILISASHS